MTRRGRHKEPRVEHSNDRMPAQAAESDALGVFSPFRAGALAGVSGYRIGQWARYGLITPSLYRGRPSNRYEFRDVAEAIVVHWLATRGFGYPAIHKAITRSRAESADWPLLAPSLGVAQHAAAGDPRGTIALRIKPDIYIDTASGSDQVTLKPQLFAHASDVLRRGGWIAQELKLRRIEVDPSKLGGAPLLVGRRWPVERVAQLAADDDGASVLLGDYGLRRPEIAESVKWVEAAARLQTGGDDGRPGL